MRDGNFQSLTLVLAFIAILQLSGCKDSGSVGDAISGSDSDLVVDTMQVTALQTDTLNSYSGNQTYFSAGRFQDPLFGDITARGLIKPLLASSNEDLLFDEDTEMKLRLQINDDGVYGDSLAEMQYNLVEINELWRGPAWQLKNNIDLVEGSTVGSFTVSDQDSIDIPLSSDWVQKYGEFYDDTSSGRDSLYLRNFFGLAVVPQNSGKIVAFTSPESKFLVTGLDNSANASLSDSLTISLRDAALSVNRTNEAMQENHIKLYNTLESVATLNFDFSSENIESNTIARVELVIYRDNLLLNETIDQAGNNAVRPDPGSLRLHFVEGDELPQSLDPGSPLTVGAYDEDDGAYHFNLTAPVNAGYFDSANPSLTFYLTQGSNNGVIRSTIIFNEQAGTKAPKVIVTSINN